VEEEHYKKLALEKTPTVSCNCQNYLDQINKLTGEVGAGTKLEW
jgi:hypothetical protein